MKIKIKLINIVTLIFVCVGVFFSFKRRHFIFVLKIKHAFLRRFKFYNVLIKAQLKSNVIKFSFSYDGVKIFNSQL